MIFISMYNYCPHVTVIIAEQQLRYRLEERTMTKAKYTFIHITSNNTSIAVYIYYMIESVWNQNLYMYN